MYPYYVIGAFIMTALMGGIEKSFGVLLISIQARYGCTTVQAAWIGSIMTTLRHLMGNIYKSDLTAMDFSVHSSGNHICCVVTRKYIYIHSRAAASFSTKLYV